MRIEGTVLWFGVVCRPNLAEPYEGLPGDPLTKIGVNSIVRIRIGTCRWLLLGLRTTRVIEQVRSVGAAQAELSIDQFVGKSGREAVLQFEVGRAVTLSAFRKDRSMNPGETWQLETDYRPKEHPEARVQVDALSREIICIAPTIGGQEIFFLPGGGGQVI